MMRREEPTGGLSVRQLTLIVFGAVAVCAMFFALGFVVGSNRRSNNSNLSVEQVPLPSEIPPTVNPPSAGPPSPPSAPGASVVEQNLASAASATSAPEKSTETPPPAPSEKAAPQSRPRRPAGPARRVMLQVAALRNRTEALSLVNRLRRRGFPAHFLTPRQAGARDLMYRVQVGPYSSRSKALAEQRRLSHAGFRSFVKE